MWRRMTKAAYCAIATSFMLFGVEHAYSAPATQPTIAACDLLKSAGQIAKEQRGSFIKEYLLNFFNLSNAPAQPQKPDLELFFTVKSSFSVQAECREGAPARADHLYYTIGLVVKKLGEIDLDGKLLLVETEYGLKTLIPDSHLAQLRKDRVYFFANQADGKPYCLKQTEEPCTAAELAPQRRLDPQSRYGIANRKQFDRRYPGDRNHILSDSSFPCGLIHVGIYGTSLAAGDPILEERGKFDTCEGPSAGVKTVRIVKWQDYESYFGKNIEGAILRPEAGVLTKIAPEFARFKACNTTVKFDSTTEGKLAGGAKINFVGLELGTELAKKYSQKFEETIGADVAIEYLAYYLSADRPEAKADALPIQIRYKCDSSWRAPRTVNEISLFHPMQRELVIPIVAPGSDAKNALVVPMVDRSQVFLDGFAFRIEGAREYLSARDQIRSIIADSSDRIETFLKDSKDDLYFARVASFFTHLVIATAGKPYRRRLTSS